MDERLKWPGDAKCAVMLSFDVDGECLFLNKDPIQWRSVSYGRYGPKRGVGHILRLLDRYNIKATFFIPGVTAEGFPDVVKEIGAAGHEIGAHGYNHELFSDYSIEEQRGFVEKSQDIIKSLTGQSMKGFRCPSGDPHPDTFAMLAEMGYTYSSSMRGDDRPYRTVINGEVSDFIEIPGKWELDDYPQLAYDFYPPTPRGLDRIKGYHLQLDNWKREFDGYYKYGYHYVIMLHPQVIGTPGKIAILEELIQYIKSFPDVWLATGSEIADWFRQNQ